jgi:ribonucleoside-triphosphate reductase
MLTKILSEDFLKKYKNKSPNWGFNGLGYIVYKRTYARPKPDGTTEEWHETVARCVEGAQSIGAGYTKLEAERLYDLVFNLKCNFAGRMLWQLGAPTVARYGGASLLNCWFVSMNEPEDFCFVFENLMLGGGVGFSVKRENVHDLPKIKTGINIEHKNTKDADFIVPDSREGWVSLLRNIVQAYFETGKSFTYSTILIRGAGEKIDGFGGTASGPQILVDGMKKITTVLRDREGKKLRSIDVLDINNIIGSIVVAGNVRRSAQIAIGDPDDHLYIRAKNWGDGNIPNWRAMSNNSIYADSFGHISRDIWESGYETDEKTGMAKGEPYGFINLPLSQKYGRLIDGPMKDCKLYPTDKDNCEGFNPCAEITLGDGEACNLCELYINNIDSPEMLNECARLLYKTQKAIWTLPFHYEKTKSIVKKNMRIGLGVTGICQSMHKVEWLDKCYKDLRKYDVEWSKERGWPCSIKLTTIKPSGTLSLLGGSTPGGHPAYSKYYIRRVRMSSTDKLVGYCRGLGYHVEYVKNFDGTESRDTVVVSFPCESGKDAIISKNMTAIEQLELVKKLQTYWADNAVSVTIYYQKSELPGIKTWMKENYELGVKSVSFLLHSEHGFAQAPYEEVTEEKYLELKKLVKPLNSVEIGDTSGSNLDVECAGGACPVR